MLWPCHIQKTPFYGTSTIPWLLQSFHFFCFLSLVGGDVDVMFGIEHSTATHSQHVDQAKVSALTVAWLQ